MQTFIIDKDIVKCAKLLDYRRLGKQRVEAMQILNAINAVKNGEKPAWGSHPCIRMWRNHEKALGYYMNVMIQEWKGRGYKNTMKLAEDISTEMPLWFVDEDLIYSHQASLLRKDPEFYNTVFNTEFINSSKYCKHGYYWPVPPLLKHKKKMDNGIYKKWKWGYYEILSKK